MLTDAFLHLVRDLKLGRLPQDSITQRKDSVLQTNFISADFNSSAGRFIDGNFSSHLNQSMPVISLLKNGIKKFLDSADYKVYTKVPHRKDTINFKEAL